MAEAAGLMGAPRGTPSERLWRRVDRRGSIPDHAPSLGRCWVWTGATTGEGYGELKVDGRVRPTHIVAWEEKNGPVPAGLELDHLCRNRICCRPSHLEAVTHEENVRRAAHAIRPTCPKGHPYEGTRISTPRRHGRRYRYRRCLVCHREGERDRRRRRTVEAAA